MLCVWCVCLFVVCVSVCDVSVCVCGICLCIRVAWIAMYDCLSLNSVLCCATRCSGMSPLAGAAYADRCGRGRIAAQNR